MEQKGVVFDIQRFSTDDGEGIRTCVFLKGCPLRCVWCHNAESLSKTSELAFYERNCVGCGECLAACPNGALSLSRGVCRINREKCGFCFACTDACNSGALVRIGKKMSVDEVMKTVLRDRAFYGEVGGITVTGGEPMAQPEFTLFLARAARAEGISVTVETSGYARTADFAALLPYCDLFLIDCKACGEKHRELTGVGDGIILENLDFLARNGANIRLRCPIVPGANLDELFIKRIIALAKKYEAVGAVQLMPYHKTGADKSEHIGKTPQTVFEIPDRQMLAALCDQIAKESGKYTYFNL